MDGHGVVSEKMLDPERPQFRRVHDLRGHVIHINPPGFRNKGLDPVLTHKKPAYLKSRAADQGIHPTFFRKLDFLQGGPDPAELQGNVASLSKPAQFQKFI